MSNKIDQNELRQEIGKRSMVNMFIHMLGIFNMYFAIGGILTGNVVSILLSGGFTIYFALDLAKRQYVVRELFKLVEDEDE